MSTVTVRCVGGHDVEANAYGLLREVNGWAEPRKGGGLHHLYFRQETGRVMCAACASRRRRGGSIDQGDLFS
jgi:hypothetical protein